jgi:hypothetical protein
MLNGITAALVLAAVSQTPNWRQAESRLQPMTSARVGPLPAGFAVNVPHTQAMAIPACVNAADVPWAWLAKGCWAIPSGDTLLVFAPVEQPAADQRPRDFWGR